MYAPEFIPSAYRASTHRTFRFAIAAVVHALDSTTNSLTFTVVNPLQSTSRSAAIFLSAFRPEGSYGRRSSSGAGRRHMESLAIPTCFWFKTPTHVTSRKALAQQTAWPRAVDHLEENIGAFFVSVTEGGALLEVVHCRPFHSEEEALGGATVGASGSAQEDFVVRIRSDLVVR